MNTPLCPHCDAPASTYTAQLDSDPKNLEVLVCAHCNKIIGVVGEV